MAAVLLAFGANPKRTVDVHGPTVIAFFALDGETGASDEALSDFQFYAAEADKPLRAAGVDFVQVYAASFEVRMSGKKTNFRPKKGVGYYFVMHGRKPHVEYGVLTQVDILEIAERYFRKTINVVEYR